jgi:outer membrane biosynthesis protein TonB
MSVQTTRDMAVAPIWSGWQSAVLNGVYPLQRLLHGSERSAVFLTERNAEGASSAAVKIIPIERVTLAQLSHWRLATGISHPHLIQLFDAGLCQLGGRQFLFVVMEYAEQTLSEVLAQRALTVDEVRELLPPTLDALSFLHRKGLVQGQLKPANLLVVNDQLKLASDSIRPAGAPRDGIAEPSMYDPPDANHAPFSSTDDMWGLGVTLVEALTQSLPWIDARSDRAGLPPTVPAEFVDTVQRCLSYNPATRPLAMDLEAKPGRVPEAPMVPAPPVAPEPSPVVATENSPGRRFTPAMAAIVVLVLLVTAWAAWRVFGTHPNSQQSTTAAAPISSPRQAAASEVTAQNATTQASGPAATGPAVVNAQMPTVPRRALRTIQGRIKISVLVVVDHSGTVNQAFLENTGPSAYFARLSREAARKWRFAPEVAQGTRRWLLRFEFTRGGVTGVATSTQ